MSEKQAKRYTPKFKFQVMLEVLRGIKSIGQIARSYGVHPISIIRAVKRPKESAIRVLLRETGRRVNLVAILKEIEDFDVLSTDFTEIRYAQGQAKPHLMPIIDHKSKLVLGHAFGESADIELALEAWKRTRFQLKRMGKKVKEVIIHHDQDGDFIGHEWLHQIAVKDKVRVSYSEDRAKGNVQIESFIGRLKEENRLLFWEQENLEALKGVVNVRIRYYNRVRRHSALGNRSPLKYLKEKGRIASRDASEK